MTPQQPQKKTIRFHAQTTVASAPVVKSDTGSVEGPTSMVNVSASAFGCPHKGKEHAIEDRKEYPPNAIPLKQRNDSNSNFILRSPAHVKEAREQQHSQDRKREEESERDRVYGREQRRKDGAFVPPSLVRRWFAVTSLVVERFSSPWFAVDWMEQFTRFTKSKL